MDETQETQAELPAGLRDSGHVLIGSYKIGGGTLFAYKCESDECEHDHDAEDRP